MEGEVRRRATFGRFLAGLAFRWGSQHTVSVRGAGGGQVAFYNSSFVAMDGTSMTGPGAGADFLGVFAAGLGADTRLGDHLLIGANLAGVFIEGPGGAFEADVHFTYAWDRPREPTLQP